MIHLFLALCSISWGQSTTTVNVIDQLRFQNLSEDVRAIQSGRPVLTSTLTVRGGVCFGDGTCQTTAATAVNNSSIAKAWVKFNGTGTPAINASFNVASITDNGTGNYTVNWDTDFASADYAVVASGNVNTGKIEVDSHAAGSVRILCYDISNNLVDLDSISVIAFGDQ